MSEANKALAQRWIDAISAGDTDAFRATMAEDVDHEVMGTCLMSGKRNREELCDAINLVHSMTNGGLTMTVTNVTAEDDRVSVEAHGSAELVNGGRYDNDYHLFFQVRDGEIVAVREYLCTKLVEDTIGPLLAEAGAG